MENTIENIKASMILIKGATFIMGDRLRLNNGLFRTTIPTAKVTLIDFHICDHVVSRAEWYAVMNEEIGKCKNPNFPITGISWHQAQSFVVKLNALSGWNFRLPTEAEWEFAARGGEFDKGEIFSGGNILNYVGWFEENSNNAIQEIKKKPSNILGLYDMSGNVWEWCQDWYHEEYTQGDRMGFFSSERHPVRNPLGPMTGSYRVIRGGSYSNQERKCWLFFREKYKPNNHTNNIGFRLAY